MTGDDQADPKQSGEGGELFGRAGALAIGGNHHRVPRWPSPAGSPDGRWSGSCRHPADRPAAAAARLASSGNARERQRAGQGSRERALLQCGARGLREREWKSQRSEPADGIAGGGNGGGVSSGSSAAVISTPSRDAAGGQDQRVFHPVRRAPVAIASAMEPPGAGGMRFRRIPQVDGHGLIRSPTVRMRARADRSPPGPAPASSGGCAPRWRAHGCGCRRRSAAPASRRRAPPCRTRARRRCMNSCSRLGAIASWRSSGGPVSASANAASHSGDSVTSGM